MITLEARSLKKFVVPPSLLVNPSPASFQPTRLALHLSEDGSSSWIYIASGCHVYQFQVPMGDSFIDKGKENLLMPSHVQIMHSAIVNRFPHRAEIQSIALGETECPGCYILGSVDCHGHLVVSKLHSGDGTDKLTYTVMPRDSGTREGSWAGLCFHPSQLSMAAVARSFSKSIDLYDQDIHLQTLHSLFYPSSLTFVKKSSYVGGCSLLAITEGCQLSVWDFRMKENGGCAHRTCASSGDILYAICTSPTGNIAVGGADRSVTIYDPRRWSILSKWMHCSKYEITGLAFSSLNTDYIYVQGTDHEVYCAQWKQRNKVFSFKGDSNWLGFSKCLTGDVLGGWCDSGMILLADIGAQDGEVEAPIGT